MTLLLQIHQRNGCLALLDPTYHAITFSVKFVPLTASTFQPIDDASPSGFTRPIDHLWHLLDVTIVNESACFRVHCSAQPASCHVGMAAWEVTLSWTLSNWTMLLQSLSLEGIFLLDEIEKRQ